MAGVLDQSYTDNLGSSSIAKVASIKYQSQGITVGLSGTLDNVDLYLKKTAAPTDNLKIEIWSNNAGEPGAKVSDTALLDCATLGAGLAWVNIPITNGGDYNINDVFHIVLYRDVLDATNYPDWGTKAGNEYAGGIRHYDTDTFSWTADANTDFNFRTYVLEAGGRAGLNTTLLGAG